MWARVAADERIPDVRVLDIAGDVMRAARNHGFEQFFGVITYGAHSFDGADRTLVSGGDPTQLLIQHIDMTSEPHIRAAFAESGPRTPCEDEALPAPPSCVWASEEVFPHADIEDHLCGISVSVKVLPARFDLAKLPGPDGAQWPFSQALFRAIVPK